MILTPAITHRNATLEDLPAIVPIYNTTLSSRLITADTEPVSVESQLSWFADHDPDHRPLWVFYQENLLVGWVSFRSSYGRPAYQGTVEISIYLDPNARVKGFGKAILAECLEKIPAYQVHTVLGFIFAHNEPSLKLFHSYGFEEWGHLPEVAELDGVKRSLKILGKRV